MWFTESRVWDSRPFQGVFQIKTIFIIMLSCYFFTVLTSAFIDGTKAMEGKTASALTRVKAEVRAALFFTATHTHTRQKQ